MSFNVVFFDQGTDMADGNAKTFGPFPTEEAANEFAERGVEAFEQHFGYQGFPWSPQEAKVIEVMEPELESMIAEFEKMAI